MRPVKRVLIVQPYGIGDLLFLTPVFRALRLLPTVERVDLLLGSRTEDVVRSNPHIDDIMVLDKDRVHGQGVRQNLKELRSLGLKLRGRRYDLLLDYSLRSEYAFWARFYLGIPRTVGFGYRRRSFLHHSRLALKEGFSGRHVVDFCCDLAEAAGIRVKDRWLEFYLTSEELQETDALLERCAGGLKDFIAMSPGGGESWGRDAHFKRWPLRYFSDLASELSKRTKVDGAVILGSPTERELCEELAISMKMPAVNLAGQVSLRMAVRVLERSALFLGNDGGLLHLAQARKKPVVGLFGPVDPGVYGPYPPRAGAAAVYKEDLDCRPCYRRFRYNSACTHLNCLRALSPEEAVRFLEAREFFKPAAILS